MFCFFFVFLIRQSQAPTMPSAGYFQITTNKISEFRLVDLEIMAAKMRADNPTMFDGLAADDPAQLNEMIHNQLRQQQMAARSEEDERLRQQRTQAAVPAPPLPIQDNPIPSSVPLPQADPTNPWAGYTNSARSNQQPPILGQMTTQMVQDNASAMAAGVQRDPKDGDIKVCIECNYDVPNKGKIQQIPHEEFLCVFCQDAKCSNCGVEQIGKQGGLSLDDFSWVCKRCKTKLRMPPSISNAHMCIQTGLTMPMIDAIFNQMNTTKEELTQVMVENTALRNQVAELQAQLTRQQERPIPPPPPPHPSDPPNTQLAQTQVEPSCRACLRYRDIQSYYSCRKHFLMACSLIREEEDDRAESSLSPLLD